MLKTSAFTVLSLVAFAANSVLCRLALSDGSIDAASFTNIRLLSGIIVLFLIVSIVNRKESTPLSASKGSWFGALMLFVYAASFSYAYISLDAATGALILFGSVQVSMLLVSVFKGERLHIAEYIGIIIAFFGFIYLMLPGVSAPSLSGFLLMCLSGLAWGMYTLEGRESKNPLVDTAYNFYRSIPLVAVLLVLSLSQIQYSLNGIILAMIAGGITSGLGYAIWYVALGGLPVSLASVLQLLVPLITALGGVLLISEQLTVRLIISTVLVLGGILIVLQARFSNR